jgi:hypothetical protein
MKHRKLRIAFSAACGLAALLLIALWMRSYWRIDQVQRITPNSALRVYLFNGRLAVDWGFRTPDQGWKWTLSALPETAPMAGPNSFLGFAFDHSFFSVPLWFIALLATAFAACPWLPWSRNFSLRTLLIAMTVAALALGLAIWSAK